MKTILTTTLVALALTSIAQTSVKFGINHQLKGEKFDVLTVASNAEGDEFKLYRVSYFISGIEISHDGGENIKLPETYLYVDGFRQEVFELGEHEIGNVDSIIFYLGIDSATNHSDPAQWPADHALAPKFPAMHWGWQAGYRFLAVEGNAGEELKTNFQAHAVGNEFYFKMAIATQAKQTDEEAIIALNADYEGLLDGIQLSSGFISHGNEGEAITAMENLRDRVFTSNDGVLSTPKQLTESAFSLYPNPVTAGVLYLNLDDQSSIERIEVVDVLGQTVATQVLSADSPRLNISKPGSYWVIAYDNNGSVARRAFVVQ